VVFVSTLFLGLLIGGCNLGDSVRPNLNQVDVGGAAAAYEAGNQYFSAGDYEAAIDSYGDAIALDPGRVEAYNNRALAHIQLRHYDEAVADLIHAVEVSGEDPEILFNLGNVQLIRGYYPQAKDAFERVLEMQPSDLDAQNNLAVALTRLAEYDRAEALLLETVRIYPDDADALANLATVYDAQGETDRALSMYRQVLEMQPNHFRTLRNLGLLEARENMAADAIRHLERYISLVPEVVNVRRIEGMIRDLRGE